MALILFPATLRFTVNSRGRQSFQRKFIESSTPTSRFLDTKVFFLIKSNQNVVDKQIRQLQDVPRVTPVVLQVVFYVLEAS
jgi:hypothetical protein